MSPPEDHAESTPIAQVRFATSIPAPEPAPWWRRRPTAAQIGLGAAGALSLAVVLGLLLTPPDHSAPATKSRSQASTVTPVALVDQFTFRPANEPYRAPNRDEVERAYAAVQQTFRTGGVSELAREGLNCFRGLERRPTFAQMDYCLAFDLFAEAENAKLAGGESPSATSWFGSVGARHVNVAQSVMAAQGDADARLLDLRRLAEDVTRRHGGPPLIDAAPALPSTGPTTTVTASAPVPGDRLAIEMVEPAPVGAIPTVTGPAPRPARRAPSTPPPAVIETASAPAVIERVAEPAALPPRPREPAVREAAPHGDEFPDPPGVTSAPLDIPAPR